MKILWRWYSTVRGLMNSRAPISGFERPPRASCALLLLRSEVAADLRRGFASGLAMARSSRQARPANPSTPMSFSIS
jgi:hypothetical protein